MSSSQKLQAIFDIEIARLHRLAERAALDAADVKRLESLVAAYSKYKAHDFKEHDDLDSLPTDDLLEYAKTEAQKAK